LKFFAWVTVVWVVGASLATAGGDYATVNGLRMYYEKHGAAKPGSPPLVILHGGSGTIETSFARLLPLLAAGRQVIAVEQQGHGHTADVDRPLSYTQMADDTAALIGTLELGKVDCLGWSDGGNVALQLAIRHPEVVRKIVAASPNFRADAMKAESVASIRSMSADDWPPPVKAAYMRVAPDPQHWGAFIAKVKRLWLETPDWPEAQLKAIHIPVLLMYGDHDDIRLEHATLMYGLIPGSQLAVLPGTSHFMLFEQPPLVAATTLTFLDSGK
jgi:pimeloyl-ACP methyl ester carboxylesterase